MILTKHPTDLLNSNIFIYRHVPQGFSKARYGKPRCSSRRPVSKDSTAHSTSGGAHHVCQNIISKSSQFENPDRGTENKTSAIVAIYHGLERRSNGHDHR